MHASLTLLPYGLDGENGFLEIYARSKDYSLSASEGGAADLWADSISGPECQKISHMKHKTRRAQCQGQLQETNNLWSGNLEKPIL